jgi:hypothetical protein
MRDDISEKGLFVTGPASIEPEYLNNNRFVALTITTAARNPVKRYRSTSNLSRLAEWLPVAENALPMNSQVLNHRFLSFFWIVSSVLESSETPF